ncbi:MAG: hypothetical protein IAI49_03390 [Candidatus Eremiobacteraeota bacterium]|nr:hypothetical protein [Candidatus Eremiobacteraeota bacterium]
MAEVPAPQVWLATFDPSGVAQDAYALDIVPESVEWTTSATPEPVESLHLAFAVDATERIARGDVLATGSGIAADLALVRRLVAQPWIVFGWGTRRVAIHPTAASIVEVSFGAALAPIRAEVTLDARVANETGSTFLATLVASDRAAQQALAQRYTAARQFRPQT